MAVLAVVAIAGWIFNILLTRLVTFNFRWRSSRVRRVSYDSVLKRYDRFVLGLSLLCLTAFVFVVGLEDGLLGIIVASDAVVGLAGVVVAACVGCGFFFFGLLSNSAGSLNWSWRRLRYSSSRRLVASSFAEEVIWRAPVLLVASISERIDVFAVAAVFSCVLFGFLHYTGDWRQVLYMAIFAFVCVLLGAVFGLLASVVVHGVHNTVRVLVRLQ